MYVRYFILNKNLSLQVIYDVYDMIRPGPSKLACTNIESVEDYSVYAAIPTSVCLPTFKVIINNSSYISTLLCINQVGK